MVFVNDSNVKILFKILIIAIIIMIIITLSAIVYMYYNTLLVVNSHVLILRLIAVIITINLIKKII